MTPTSELNRLFPAIPKPDPLGAMCGGCGERNQGKRCVGCLHDFGPVDADEAYIWAGDGWLDIATDERFYADNFGNGVFVPFYAEPFFFQEH